MYGFSIGLINNNENEVNITINNTANVNESTNTKMKQKVLLIHQLIIKNLHHQSKEKMIHLTVIVKIFKHKLIIIKVHTIIIQMMIML